MIRCRAILFDLDGVLVDSDTCVREVCTEWALARGLDPALVLSIGRGRRVQDTIRAVAPHLDVEAEAMTLIDLEAHTTKGLAAAMGADALIASLPPNAWAVVTSGARPVATLRLRHVGLPIPATLVTADDVAQGKPHPEGYLAAAKALDTEPRDCVVIEDAPAGLVAAHAAGMRSIGVAGTFPPEALSMADFLIPSLAALQVRSLAGGLEIRI